MWRFTPEKEISCCSLTPDGLAIVYGHVGEKQLQLAVFNPDKSSDESSVADHDSFTESYIATMCSKEVPYGDSSMSETTIDLKQ